MITIVNRSVNIKSERKELPILILLSLLTIIFVSIIENSLSILLISSLWIGLGLVLIKISFPRSNRVTSYRLWLIIFLVYYLYMWVANSLYVGNPFTDFFFHLDSLSFFSATDSLVTNTSKIAEFNWDTYETKKWPGFMFLSWLLGRMAITMGEHNNIMLQKTQTVFVCAMTIVFLYNMSRLYLSQHRSWKVALTFGLLTHMLAFSGTYTRDPHLFLLFTIGIYIFLSKWSVRNLFVLLLIGVLAAQFRLVNGVFFIGTFVIAYLYLRLRASSSNKLVSVIFGALVIGTLMATVVIMSGEYIDTIFFTVDKYQTYQEGKFAETVGGNISYISQLPAPLRLVGNFLLSQTYPFPAYKAVNVAVIDEVQWMKFPLVIAQVVWVTVWGFLLYGLFKRSYREKLPLHLKYALTIAIILILSNCIGSYEIRRMLGVYPILYLVSAIVYFNMRKTQRQRLLTNLFVAQAAFLIVYLMVTIIQV